MIGIYAIRNTKNGKMYIGESIDIEKRWKSHQEDLDNGNHHSYKLQEDYDKSKSKEFRFFVLEEFIFPFNAKIDATKLQLILYCREYYLGDPHINGYNKDSILLTSLGLNRYQEMARQIYDYVSPEMLSTNEFGKFYIPIDTLVNNNT